MKTVIITPKPTGETIDYSHITDNDTVIAISICENPRRYIVRKSAGGYAVYSGNIQPAALMPNCHPKPTLKDMFEYLKDFYTFYVL